MAARSLVAELRSFCETTSVRGVPRIFKARSRPVVVVWALAVVGCAALLGWQVGLVLSRYFRFPVSTLFVQAPSWQRPTFPDITVCNLSPLVYESYFSLKYADYVQRMLRKLENLEADTTNFTADERNKLVDPSQTFPFYLVSPTTYLNSFPLVSSFEFNENDSLILNCSYFDWFGDIYVDRTDCMATMQAAWDPTYYKCFTLTLNDSDRTNVRGFSAVMYVDNYQKNQIVEFDVQIRHSRADGARVLIHAPGTAPDMTLGLSVSSGMETSIQLDQTTRTRLDHPYSNCTTKPYLSECDTNIKYSEDVCVDTCLQKHLIDKCGCVGSKELYTLSQLQHVNFTVCANTSRGDLFKSYLCTINFQELDEYNFRDHCSLKCVTPCTSIEYKAVPSAAFWPQLSTQVAFYNTFIRNKTRFGNKFDALELAYKNVYEKNASALAYLQSLDAAGLIRNNFLQLNVQFGSPRFNVQKDVPEFSVDAMGAQIGGVLSLWLGVTVMFLFEIIELIYTVISRASRITELQVNDSTQQSKL